MNMDKSYMSRILAKFEKERTYHAGTGSEKQRNEKIRLTETGKEKAKQIDLRGDEQIVEKLCGDRRGKMGEAL